MSHNGAKHGKSASRVAKAVALEAQRAEVAEWQTQRIQKTSAEGRTQEQTVELALAQAVVLAAQAGRWRIVRRLVLELEARRQERTGE
jgi:hypothetical protein